MADATTCDALLCGRLMLTQPAKGHRAGTDALLLAALARGIAGERVADLGAGVGTAGLALATLETQRRVTLVEIDPALAELARGNASRADPPLNVTVVEADVTSTTSLKASGMVPGQHELVMMNPPFLDEAKSRMSPVAQRRGSHAMAAGNLALWLKAARWLLRPKRHVALIHRADALAETLAALETGFGAICIRPVQPRADAAAMRILVTAQLGSRAPLSILPPLVIHGADGQFTAQAEAIHHHLAAIT
jgi:tRNA1(Val) A37 N6-methylase TrmN6